MSNRLQLNATKTEAPWCTPPRRLNQLPGEPRIFGSDAVVTVRYVRDLGIFVGVTMSIHVSKIVASCFAALRQLRSIWRSVSSPVLLSLVTSKCCRAWTTGVQLLQAFPNTCWIVSSRFSVQQHVSFAELRVTTCLHYFRNYTGCQRIKYRLAVVVFLQPVCKKKTIDDLFSIQQAQFLFIIFFCLDRLSINFPCSIQ